MTAVRSGPLRPCKLVEDERADIKSHKLRVPEPRGSRPNTDPWVPYPGANPLTLVYQSRILSLGDMQGAESRVFSKTESWFAADVGRQRYGMCRVTLSHPACPSPGFFKPLSLDG